MAFRSEMEDNIKRGKTGRVIFGGLIVIHIGLLLTSIFTSSWRRFHLEEVPIEPEDIENEEEYDSLNRTIRGRKSENSSEVNELGDLVIPVPKAIGILRIRCQSPTVDAKDLRMDDSESQEKGDEVEMSSKNGTRKSRGRKHLRSRSRSRSKSRRISRSRSRRARTHRVRRRGRWTSASNSLDFCSSWWQRMPSSEVHSTMMLISVVVCDAMILIITLAAILITLPIDKGIRIALPLAALACGAILGAALIIYAKNTEKASDFMRQYVGRLKVLEAALVKILVTATHGYSFYLACSALVISLIAVLVGSCSAFQMRSA